MKFTYLFILLIPFLLCQCKQKSDSPKLYIIGDSTVKNGKGDGSRGLWGWGDYIHQYFDTTKIKVRNHARGGTSTRTFRSLGLWQPVLDSLNNGDVLLIQFGHNDNNKINDDRRARGTIKGIGEECEKIRNMLTGYHEIVHSYGWYLRQYINEAKSKGAFPVIVSPIPRNNWKDSKVVRNHNDYGLWAKQIAEEFEIPFIDLNEKMALEMENLGESKVTGVYFYERDHTHTTARGAAINASLIVDYFKNNKVCKLRKYLLKNPVIQLPPKKNVYIIGDSTVDGKSDKTIGWAKYLPEFLDTIRLNIYDKARGGRSSRTYRSEGLWDDVKDSLKSGDFVLIQFGHNDGGKVDEGKKRASLKGIGDQLEMSSTPQGEKEVVHTYGWYIRQYIKEAKQKGAIPIVFSQVPRNEWPNNKVERVNENYGLWASEVANYEKVTFIDLNEAVAVKYEELGKKKVKSFFPKDHTHTNDEGAKLNALTIAELISKDKTCGLRNFIELNNKK